MTETPASQRRGSGISISLAPSNAVGGVITPGAAQNGVPIPVGQQPMYPPGAYGPIYMQSPSYPVLINPSPMPTVSISSQFNKIYKKIRGIIIYTSVNTVIPSQ